MELGKEKMVPHTIENTRESDETVCRPEDEEMLNAGNDVVDEFTGILRKECTPKILIMTSRQSSNSAYGSAFISHLISVIPNAHYFKRGTCELKKVVQYANEKEFTSMIVVHNKRRGPESLLIVGLPDGPTADFKLSNVRIPEGNQGLVVLLLSRSFIPRLPFKMEEKYRKVGPHTNLLFDLSAAGKLNHGKPTSDKPKLVLTNFTTSLGNRLGRMIQSLFPQDPVLRGRRVVTFHNQHDVIVFRHHRYIFETKEGKQTESKGEKSMDEKNPRERKIARLQECGPRFTLKLICLQRGYADGGEYEWVNKHEMDTSRRRHALDLPLEFQGLRI